jgi:hypothetical protein
LITSDDCVVKHHAHNESAVEDGEGDEELVEGIGHLFGGEDDHREDVAGQAHRANQGEQDALQQLQFLVMY